MRIFSIGGYIMKTVDFIEQVFEIAFGDNAINRNFTYNEVIEKLKEFSDNSLIVEGDQS